MQPTPFRWFIVFLLFAITIVNYIDRAAISYAIPLIQKQLGFSATESGAILGAFGLGYAIATLLGGFSVDRWGARIFTDGFLLMAVLALSSVVVVLLFHHPDKDAARA